MMEFETSPSVSCCNAFQCHPNYVSQLTSPAASEIYHYQHLCDKNGWTSNIWEHDGGISMTTWAFLSITSSSGQCKLLAKNMWLIWPLKVKYHTDSAYNRLSHCQNSPSVQDPYGDGSHVYVLPSYSK
jgi:hypothetical protein